MVQQDELGRDLQLVRMALLGSQKAWNEIIRTYSGLLHKRAYPVFGLGHTDEDVVQEMWAYLLTGNKLHQYNGKSPLGYWLQLQIGARNNDLKRSASALKRIPVDATEEFDIDVNDSMHPETPDEALTATRLANDIYDDHVAGIRYCQDKTKKISSVTECIEVMMCGETT